ncbi:recombinase family protein [Streptomyces uncialis]|uniref:recombinase family protein n=1 Tax=Streptomyces uncialis TaxID=1048205 RepID=UPI0036474DC1
MTTANIVPLRRINCDYGRVSDDETGAGDGVESQHEECTEFGEEIGHPITATYQDNSISAFSGAERPDYQRMLRDMARGLIAVIIIWHADRLTRDVQEGLDFIKIARGNGVRLFSVQKGGEYLLNRASGRHELISDINLAQRESGHKGERIGLARRRQARRGQYGGGVRPYGWGVDTGRVRSVCVNPRAPLSERIYEDRPVLDMTQHNEEEAAEIRLWAEELLATQGNLAALLRGLKERGVLTATQKDGRVLKRKGKEVRPRGWSNHVVVQILIAPRVSGHAIHKGEIVLRNAYKAIIPEEKRQALIAVLMDPSRNKRAGSVPKWLGSLIYECGLCGVGTVTARYAEKGAVYRCKTCHRGNQLAVPLDEYIEQVMVERLSRGDVELLLRPQTPEVDLAEMRSEIEDLEGRKSEAAMSYALRKIDLGMLETTKATVDARIAELRSQLVEAAGSSPLADFLNAGSAAAARSVWDSRTLARKRELIKLILCVELFMGAVHELDPATVRVTPKVQPVDGDSARA